MLPCSVYRPPALIYLPPQQASQSAYRRPLSNMRTSRGVGFVAPKEPTQPAPFRLATDGRAKLHEAAAARAEEQRQAVSGKCAVHSCWRAKGLGECAVPSCARGCFRRFSSQS